MRKWYGWLFGGTVVVIAGLLWLRGAVGTPIKVSVWELAPQTMTETVRCNGRLETAGSEEVYVDYLCVADRVLVKKGDQVKAGDVLFTVDVEQTKQVLSGVAGLSPSVVPNASIVQEVTSPINGTVETLNVTAGKQVGVQKACAVITVSDTLQVAVTIGENQLRDVQVGQTATVSGSAFAREAYDGTVTSIASTARQVYVGTVSTTVVDAVITLEDPDASLKPGLTARTEIQVGRQEECLVVPYECIVQDDKGQEYVYVLRDGYAVKQRLSVTKEWSGGIAVAQGVSAGDRVVYQPEGLSGDRVRVQVIS